MIGLETFALSLATLVLRLDHVRSTEPLVRASAKLVIPDQIVPSRVLRARMDTAAQSEGCLVRVSVKQVGVDTTVLWNAVMTLSVRKAQ